MSFGAYFNALRRRLLAALEPLTEVRLQLRLEGSGRVDVYRTKADGSRDLRARRGARQPRACTSVDLELDLRPFEDGGWYWFDLTTDDGDADPARGRLVRRRARRPAGPP